ncbi:hypothetical protein OF846_004464 [Rhodotorula toruloides]|nr:hypothetical protein OF846_004464 [Rhodotorula toruloides]
MDDLVQALAHRTTLPITLSSLPSLSPADLAFAALQPDLPPLVRQRAYHAFTERRATYHANTDSQAADPLLDLPLDYPIPAALSSLSLPHLLLLPYNPSCDSSLLTHAHQLLLSLLAREAKKRELKVLRMCVRWEGGERREEGLRMRIEEGGLRVVRDGEGGEAEEEGFTFEAGEMREVLYIAGADDGHTSMDCTLSLSLSSLALSPLVSIKECIVRLELGMLEAGDEAFVKLREKVGQWAAEGAFEVRVVRADLAKNGFASPPASPPKNRCAKLAPPPPPPPPPANFEPQRQPIARKQTRQLETAPLGTRPPPPAGLEAEIWQYVSDRPAPVEWQPGFYARAFAFLSSLVPYDTLSAPVFTPAEVALLSFAPIPDALPDLHGKRMRGSTSARFENTERLALEYLYKSGPPITLDATRLVLLTPSYPSLHHYVRTLSKIVAARDALVIACNQVLERRLYLRRGDPTVVDPIEELISVVERIRDNVAYRKSHFATSPTH